MSAVVGCPHCHGEISTGARVCRGCQAEVEYGAPRWANLGAAVVGTMVLAVFAPMSPLVGAVLGLAAAVGLYVLAKKVFAGRIYVKRRYIS